MSYNCNSSILSKREKEPRVFLCVVKFLSHVFGQYPLVGVRHSVMEREEVGEEKKRVLRRQHKRVI